MFMRYRGGGIGHKYMREIESKFENMSRERLHGKQPRHEPRPSQTNNTGIDSTSDSDDEPEDPVQPGTPQGDGPVTRSPGSDGGGENEVSENDDDNEDYAPSETGSSSDEVADSDEITSDFDSDFDYDSYGLADP